VFSRAHLDDTSCIDIGANQLRHLSEGELLIGNVSNINGTDILPALAGEFSTTGTPNGLVKVIRDSPVTNL
tara:strand:- start:171 stop:383 length:213 start_codon:yes stop_codon:yes gene_type:complete